MKPIKTYYANGQLKYEEWWVDRKYHRLDGPAYQKWYENGHLRYEVWFVDGKYHRLDGPAYRRWDRNGQLEIEDWYFNGIEYKKEEHPFNVFRKEHSLKETYEKWPNDMKVLFEMVYK